MRIFRKYKARKEYVKIRDAILKIQHAYKGWKLRIDFLKKRRAAIVIQSHLRGVFARGCPPTNLFIVPFLKVRV